ncbi:glucose 1-dehydrogenase [Flavobacteriaceae bacterium]|nr:glucose 1-dehydrogenase [Flavobacteriaceae bacterium]MDC1492222.1 glucose 1-dehydrogenase [Flavobacteriaceae bacterium]
MKNKFNLDKKVAIITGASKGIGKAIAISLAELGATVIVSSRNQDSVNKTTNEICSMGFKAEGIVCHVGKEDQLTNLVNTVLENHKKIDILINNAATNPHYGPLAKTDGGLFDKMMEINVKAPFNLANLCFPIMKKNGGGSIINIASVEGLRPSEYLGLYCVSKSALIMLTKSQAKEWGKFGIRSNAICPGLIKTKFSQGLWDNEKMLNQFTKELPLGRIASPDEMASLACYLASEASSYTTGSIHVSDGGHMIAGN